MDGTSSDEELMLRYRDGDAAAFEILYRRHRGGLFRYCLRQCPSRAQAEEVFQDVWTNLIGARARYRVEAKFTTYLYRLAHNRLIDIFRRQPGVRVVSLDDEDDPPADPPAPESQQPERLLDVKQQAASMLAAIEALPAAQREVFLLHEEGELSLDEIAQVTGADREAVKSRLRYALAKLRAGLKEVAT